MPMFNMAVRLKDLKWQLKGLWFQFKSSYYYFCTLILFFWFQVAIVKSAENNKSERKEKINWELCCLCQVQKEKRLQTPKDEGLASLEKHLHVIGYLVLYPVGWRLHGLCFLRARVLQNLWRNTFIIYLIFRSTDTNFLSLLFFAAISQFSIIKITKLDSCDIPIQIHNAKYHKV